MRRRRVGRTQGIGGVSAFYELQFKRTGTADGIKTSKARVGDALTPNLDEAVFPARHRTEAIEVHTHLHRTRHQTQSISSPLVEVVVALTRVLARGSHAGSKFVLLLRTCAPAMAREAWAGHTKDKQKYIIREYVKTHRICVTAVRHPRDLGGADSMAFM